MQPQRQLQLQGAADLGGVKSATVQRRPVRSLASNGLYSAQQAGSACTQPRVTVSWQLIASILGNG
jgi:hypothetical protein